MANMDNFRYTQGEMQTAIADLETSKQNMSNDIDKIKSELRDKLLECAKKMPDVPFLVAGAYDGMPGIRENAPANVEWRGFVKGDDLRKAYLDSRIVVIPSRCYEGFPNVIVQAMQLERPVIAVDLGASGAVVEDGVTGLKFRPGDIDDLKKQVQTLYKDSALCEKFGKTGRSTALELYSRESIYTQLTDIYQRASARKE